MKPTQSISNEERIYLNSTIQKLSAKIELISERDSNEQKARMNRKKIVEYNFLMFFINQLSNIPEMEIYCKYSWNRYKNRIIQECERLSQKTDPNPDEMLLIYCLEFYYEFYLSYIVEKESPNLIIKQAHLILENEDGLFDDIKENISHTVKVLPYLIIKTGPIRVEQEKFKIELEEIEKKLEGKIISAQQKIDLIDSYDKIINGVLQKYNFAGLHHGFSSMYEEKKSGNKKYFWTLLLLALSAIVVPAITSLISYKLSNAGVGLDIKFMVLLPILGIEILIIYFFRITYGDYKSTLSQILQIKLRMTLCEFIESYTTFAQKNDRSTLEKFENVIFSGIVVDPHSIPSTFDGIDQIGNMIEKVKGK